MKKFYFLVPTQALNGEIKQRIGSDRSWGLEVWRHKEIYGGIYKRFCGRLELHS